MREKNSGPANHACHTSWSTLNVCITYNTNIRKEWIAVTKSTANKNSRSILVVGWRGKCYMLNTNKNWKWEKCCGASTYQPMCGQRQLPAATLRETESPCLRWMRALMKTNTNIHLGLHWKRQHQQRRLIWREIANKSIIWRSHSRRSSIYKP